MIVSPRMIDRVTAAMCIMAALGCLVVPACHLLPTGTHQVSGYGVSYSYTTAAGNVVTVPVVKVVRLDVVEGEDLDDAVPDVVRTEVADLTELELGDEVEVTFGGALEGVTLTWSADALLAHLDVQERLRSGG